MVQVTRRDAIAALAVARCSTPARETNKRFLSAAITQAHREDFGEVVTQAKSCGISSLPLSIFWDDLEQQPSVYGGDQNWLAIANRFFPVLGVDVQLVVSVIDTNNDRRPAWLKDQPFDSPACTQAFERFLGWVFGQVPQLGQTSLAIGNEIDVFLGNQVTKWRESSAFFNRAATTAKSRFPDIQIGTKMTWAGLIGFDLSTSSRNEVDMIVGRSDHIAATYYPIAENFQMKPP
jgi:hypothetical protein